MMPTSNATSNTSFSEEKILNCQLSIVSKKDFSTEVRALADIRKFVSDAFILMDLNKTQVSEIVHEILDRLGKFRHLGEDVVAEAKTMLFVEPSNQLIASTMQGLYKTRTDGRLAYDNSWLVAMCNLSTITKRIVAIAKLAQPTNFGRQSQEVRVLIIILTPNKDKLTKSALETGRTFATMFTDINFRHRLYRAKTEYEFKIELLSMAELLAAPIDSLDALCKRQAQYLTLRHKLGDSFAQSPSNAGGVGASVCRAGDSAGDDGTPSDVVVTQEPLGQLTTLKGGDAMQQLVDSLFAGKLTAAAKSVAATGGAADSSGSSNASNDPNNSKAKAAAACCKVLTPVGSGLVSDYKRRAHFYWSDFRDGVCGDRSLYKTTSATVFLYFSVFLPCIAFGVVDTNNTQGQITVSKTIAGQAIGGLFFALLGGQPLVVLMTTAPLCIYVKVIYQISQDFQVDFLPFYASVGLWMSVFLMIMSITNLSNLMKFCTHSTEDIFAIFTAVAFGSDGIHEAIRSFRRYYYEASCYSPASVTQLLGSESGSAGGTIEPIGSFLPAASSINHDQFSTPTNNSLLQPDTTTTLHEAAAGCHREVCILFLFLMCGTLWLSNSFSSFNQTPYLSPRKREIIKDYALAISVLIFSFVGSYFFAEIKLSAIEFGHMFNVELVRLDLLTAESILIACPLGFMLSVLFYIDQNICGAMVNNAPYKLKKGDYFHLDLLVLAILNSLLSLFGFPWMQGKLPHSHLHSKALADYEERVDEGHVHQTIVNIRETRLTGIFCSVLIGLTFVACPDTLSLIPLPVLSGVFLYTALAEFKSNSMVERVCLLFTEQAAYPPNHYIRRCPQRKIHLFTFMQIIQLAVVLLVGFYPNPYVNMAYPLIVATFMPLREKVLPSLIDAKYLNSLDHPSFY